METLDLVEDNLWFTHYQCCVKITQINGLDKIVINLKFVTR